MDFLVCFLVVSLLSNIVVPNKAEEGTIIAILFGGASNITQDNSDTTSFRVEVNQPDDVSQQADGSCDSAMQMLSNQTNSIENQLEKIQMMTTGAQEKILQVINTQSKMLNVISTESKSLQSKVLDIMNNHSKMLEPLQNMAAQSELRHNSIDTQLKELIQKSDKLQWNQSKNEDKTKKEYNENFHDIALKAILVLIKNQLHVNKKLLNIENRLLYIQEFMSNQSKLLQKMDDRIELTIFSRGYN